MGQGRCTHADIEGVTVLDSEVMLPNGHAWGRDVQVEVFSGCVGVLDQASAADVWEDLVYDGPRHQHGVGMSWLPGGFVVRVPFDGVLHGRLLRLVGQPDGGPVGAWVDLGNRDLVSHPGEGHNHAGHGHIPDGWTDLFEVPVTGTTGALGDPSAGPWAYDAASTVQLEWPVAPGRLRGRVHMVGGSSTHLLTWWAALTR